MHPVLIVALVLLIAVVIWLFIEVIVLIRRVRPVLDHADEVVQSAKPVVTHADEVVEQVKPIIAQVQDAMDGITPEVEHVGPIMEKAVDSVESLSSTLQNLDTILGGVSRVSKTAGNAVGAVSDAAGSLASRARSLFGRGHSTPHTIELPTEIPASSDEPQELGDGEGTEDQDETASIDLDTKLPPVVSEDAGYFTYPDAGSKPKASADQDVSHEAAEEDD